MRVGLRKSLYFGIVLLAGFVGLSAFSSAGTAQAARQAGALKADLIDRLPEYCQEVTYKFLTGSRPQGGAYLRSSALAVSVDNNGGCYPMTISGRRGEDTARQAVLDACNEFVARPDIKLPPCTVIAVDGRLDDAAFTKAFGYLPKSQLLASFKSKPDPSVDLFPALCKTVLTYAMNGARPYGGTLKSSYAVAQTIESEEQCILFWVQSRKDPAEARTAALDGCQQQVAEAAKLRFPVRFPPCQIVVLNGQLVSEGVETLIDKSGLRLLQRKPLSPVEVAAAVPAPVVVPPQGSIVQPAPVKSEAKKSASPPRPKADTAKEAESVVALPPAAPSVKPPPPALAAAQPQPPENKFASKLTDKNTFLLSGAVEDLVGYINVGSAAPNAVVNLKGDISFGGGAAVICFSPEAPLTLWERKLVESEFDRRGISIDKVVTRSCPQFSADMPADIFLIRRAEFLREDIPYGYRILDDIEERRLVAGFGVTAAAAKAAEDKRAVELASLERQIVNQATTGYGVVALENSGTLLCNTSSELEKVFKDVSRDLMNRRDYDRFDVSSLTVANVDSETAFISAKKSQCRAIFGAANVLNEQIQGFKRDKVAYYLDGRWISPDTINAYVDGKSADEKRHLQETAEAKQRLAAEQELAARRDEADGKVKAQRQAELQSANRARVTGLSAELTKDQQELIASKRLDDRIAIVGIFPELVKWYRTRQAEGWEFVDSSIDVVDYGSANWKQRSLEAYAARSTIRLKHAGLGEYRDYCYVGSYIVDMEFKVLREPFFALCDGAQKPFDNWKASNQFASRWLVP